MRKGCKLGFSILAILVLIGQVSPLYALSWLSKNDPYPMYTAVDPTAFLYTRHRQILKRYPVEVIDPERMDIHFSVFGQNAKTGKSLNGIAGLCSTPTGNLTLSDGCWEIGDIISGGRWNMIGLLFGPLPQGRTLPPSLTIALNNLFPGVVPGTLNDPDNIIDPAETFGFFSLPGRYRKRGFRWEFETKVFNDVGMTLQAGVSNISLRVDFNNLTCNWTQVCPFNPVAPLTIANVDDFLMNKTPAIAAEIGLDICRNFNETHLEDTRAFMWWRHAFHINEGRDTWHEFLCIPYMLVGGQVATGKEENPYRAFDLSFGSNGHNAVGMSAGINFDFVTTIELGAEIGFTHFFPRDRCIYVPNSQYQSGIYPFTTSVHYKPGNNYEFLAKMHAYEFLERLSFYFQYVLISHTSDSICQTNPEPEFDTDLLECRSPWKAQMANVALYYDVSPNMILGLLWQAPLQQKNTFKSTTILFSFTAIF